MKQTVLFSCACGLLAAALATAIGCAGAAVGPNIGPFGYPIPVTPYLQDKEEDAAWERERYKRGAVVMDPIVPGSPCVAMDPPSDDEVIRKLEEVRGAEGGVPYLHETQRNNVRIVKELMQDNVDAAPRMYPLAGPCQLHMIRYKCTVYFSETERRGWPVPHTIQNEDAQEVVYIDKAHLHRVAGGSTASATVPSQSGSFGY
ncbi:MAG: hypothetical protein PHE53_04730 [Thermoguttaceae bacterium]|nr:hypothetical protein [Thermoguttaceae bacterium]